MKKNIIKGIIWFFVSQIIVNIIVIYFVGIITPNPFAKLYSPQNTFAYMLFSSLIFLPIYFLFGIIGGRILKLNSKRQLLIGIALFCAILQTTLFIWVMLIDDHSVWLIYSMLNSPHGWAIGKVGDYENLFGFLFTILPSIVFVSGAYLQNKIKLRIAK